MRTLLSFIAILLLATSSFPIGFADTTPTDSQNIESMEQPIVKTRNIISISLEESVGITSESPRKKQINNISNPIIIDDFGSKLIHLDEKLILDTSINNQKTHLDIIIVQPQTIIERISPTEKIRDDRKKTSKIDLSYLNENNQKQSSESLFLIESNIQQSTFFIDPLNLLSDPINQQNIKNILEFTNILDNESFTYNFKFCFKF